MYIPARRPTLPLFMKVGLAISAAVTLGLFAIVVYGAVSLISAGPDGIGRAIGEAMRAYDSAR